MISNRGSPKLDLYRKKTRVHFKNITKTNFKTSHLLTLELVASVLSVADGLSKVSNHQTSSSPALSVLSQVCLEISLSHHLADFAAIQKNIETLLEI